MLRLIQRMCLVLTLVSPLYAQTGQTPGETPPQMQQTVDSIDDALATVIVGDVQGLLGQFGALASQSNASLSGESLKQQLGAQLGDPELKGLPAGAGVAMMSFPGMVQTTFIEVASESIEAYKTTLTNQGFMTEAVEGLLVGARMQPGLDAGKAVASQVKNQLFQGAGQPTVEIRLDMNQIIEMYGQQFQFMLQQVTGMMQQRMGTEATQPSMQSVQKLIQAEVQAFFDIARQVDNVTAVISFGEAGAVLEKTVTPVAGSDLAKLAAAPTQSSDALAGAIPAGGAARGWVMFNGEALGNLVNNILTSIMTQMATPAEAQSAMNEIMRSMNLLQGEGFSYILPGGQFPNGVVLYQATSADAAQQAYQVWMKQFQTDAIEQIYSSIGMQMTIESNEKVRDYNGVAIGQLKMNVQDPAPATGLSGNLQLTYELAVVNDMILMTLGNLPIEKYIDSVKTPAAPVALRSLGTMPKGGDAYIDLSAGELLNALKGMIPPEQAAKMPDLQGAQPITFYMDATGQTILGRMMIPADLINRVAEFIRSQQAPPATQPAM